MLQPFGGSESLDSAQSKGQGEETHFHSLPLRCDSIKFAFVGGRIDTCLLIAVQVRKEICQHRFKPLLRWEEYQTTYYSHLEV